MNLHEHDHVRHVRNLLHAIRIEARTSGDLAPVSTAFLTRMIQELDAAMDGACPCATAGLED